MTESTTRPCEPPVTVLVIPVDFREPITIVAVENSTRAIATAVRTDRVDDYQVTTCTGIRLGVYTDTDVAAEQATGSGRLQGNPRAAMLLARLGVEDRPTLASLCGGVVITGRDSAGADTAVPDEALAAVSRCGLEAPGPAM